MTIYRLLSDDRLTKRIVHKDFVPSNNNKEYIDIKFVRIGRYDFDL